MRLFPPVLRVVVATPVEILAFPAAYALSLRVLERWSWPRRFEGHRTTYAPRHDSDTVFCPVPLGRIRRDVKR